MMSFTDPSALPPRRLFGLKRRLTARGGWLKQDWQRNADYLICCAIRSGYPKVPDSICLMRQRPVQADVRAGGGGQFLVHWMVEGSPEFDLPSVYLARFPSEIDRKTALDRIRATYERGYSLT